MKIKEMLLAFMAKGAYAAGEAAGGSVGTGRTSAVSTTPNDVKLTDGIRMVYSREIEYKAIPQLRFAQFATVQTELGTEPGLTISMLTYDNLKLGGAINEEDKIATQALSSSLKAITVREHANAVSNSELLIQSSFDDILRRSTDLLARDYALVLDSELRDVALSGSNVVYAKSNAAPNVVINSRDDLEADSLMKVSTVKDAIEILATNNAPKYNGTNWICFVHPHQSRGLRDDPAWINASNYGDPEALFTGEIGRIDDTRFIETTMMSNGADAATSPGFKAYLKNGFGGDADGNPALAKTDVYQACLFGDAYFAIAWSLPVELRDNGVIDFGRTRELAWYAIWGTGLLHDDYGVVIETA